MAIGLLIIMNIIVLLIFIMDILPIFIPDINNEKTKKSNKMIVQTLYKFK